MRTNCISKTIPLTAGRHENVPCVKEVCFSQLMKTDHSLFLKTMENTDCKCVHVTFCFFDCWDISVNNLLHNTDHSKCCHGPQIGHLCPITLFKFWLLFPSCLLHTFYQLVVLCCWLLLLLVYTILYYS